MGWLNVLDAHRSLGIELPVNLRFCFEGMEESGSEGLDDLIKSEVEKGAEGWFHGVDCVCIVRCFPLGCFATVAHADGWRILANSQTIIGSTLERLV